MENDLHRREKPKRSAGQTGRQGEKTQKKTRWRRIKLAVCLTVFLVTAAAKLAFPESTAAYQERIRQSIAWNMDYRAAAETFSQAIDGKMPIPEAFSEIFRYAFSMDGNRLWS